MEATMQRLEHANLNVCNAQHIIDFIRIAFPSFSVRGSGTDDHGRPWYHIGTDDTYLALTTVGDVGSRTPYGATTGLNHLGFEVDDLPALQARMEGAGHRHNLEFSDHPARRRLYYHDPEGNDWEFVEYHTADVRLRNDYEQ
jgi:catechol 2,3-dioxygenase-like lactoylglutathione lyase family enzyme